MTRAVDHDSGPVRVPVAGLGMDSLSAHAHARTLAMRGRAMSYGRTSQQMNEVGMLGERAAAMFLASHLEHIHLNGDDPDSVAFGGGDLTVTVFEQKDLGLWSGMGVGLEVKTNRFSAWKTIGRVLNAHQLERLHAKAVIWCVVADTLPTTSVIVMGWLPTDDIRAPDASEPVTMAGQPCLRVLAPMRAPADLPPWIRSLPIPRF